MVFVFNLDIDIYTPYTSLETTNPMPHHSLRTQALYLTAREKEILALIAKGFCSKQIAHELSISMNTVRNHRVNMLNKCGVKNFCELTLLYAQFFDKKQ